MEKEQTSKKIYLKHYFRYFVIYSFALLIWFVFVIMGAKASTANNGGQSPRTRTFSSSSSSDVVSGNTTSYNIMRGISGIHISTNHQRHSVPNHNDGILIPSGNSQNNQNYTTNQIGTGSPDSSNDESSASGAVGISRGATSLPSHIFLNGESLIHITKKNIKPCGRFGS